MKRDGIMTGSETSVAESGRGVGDGKKIGIEMPRMKCVVVDRHVLPCVKLEHLLNETNSRSGISIYSVFSSSTMNPTRNVVCSYSGDHKTKGMILNFCPMCGEEISSHVQ